MAFISKELIDEVKSKNDIVDVIGGYINLNDKWVDHLRYSIVDK